VLVLVQSINAEVHPWYWQFYLQRGDAEWASERVSAQGYDLHLESFGGFVYVGTWTYGGVTSVTLEIHDDEPIAPKSDHAAEVPLGGDGPLALLNWEPGEAPVAQVDLPAGPMALRASWTGLQAVLDSPELEVSGGLLSPEVIQFQIWPSTEHRLKILKSWSSQGS
jgi:hypothetical protein